jgi:hypothetical protein
MEKICDSCGNQYDKCFEINFNFKTYTFDCFECAIYALAPNCKHCQCKIVGHGVEEDNQIFCCVHCAKSMGKTDLKDRA